MKTDMPSFGKDQVTALAKQSQSPTAKMKSAPSKEGGQRHRALCQVRQVQDMFDVLYEKAEELNLSIEQHLNNLGFQSFEDFILARCPQFSLFCPPMDFK